MPEFRRLRTLRLPFDVHGDLKSKVKPAPCGFHHLRGIAHLVHKDFYFGFMEPATTGFARESVLRYTAVLGAARSPDSLAMGTARSTMLMLAVGATSTSTLVYTSPDGPRVCSNLHPLKHLHPIIRAGPFTREEYKRKAGCTVPHHCVHRRLLAIALMALWNLNRTHLLRVVGLEQLEAETGGVVGSAITHVDYLVGYWAQLMTSRRFQMAKNAVQNRSSQLFITTTVARFARNHVGHEAMPRALRRQIHRKWEKVILTSWRNGEQI